MHHKLVYSKSGDFFITGESAGIVTTPQNAGFDPEHILARLRWVEPHTYEELDADALASEQHSTLYTDAMQAAGTRYPIRQVFGTRKHSAMSIFGKQIPALLVYKDATPVEVFPHPEGDGYVTIRDYVDGLAVHA